MVTRSRDSADHINQTAAHGTTTDIVGVDDVQSLTEKTITDFTNLVHANAVHHRVKNLSGAIIYKGQPVMFSGYNVGQDAVEVDLADNAVGVCIGIAEADMAINAFGQIIANGTLSGFDTSGYSAGTILYVNGSGVLTDVEPTTNLAQPIAFVLREHASFGALLINADYPKQDAADVRFTAYGDLATITVQAAIQELDDEKIAVSTRGVANGVATLDGSGLIPTVQLPSFVDDVLEYANLAAFPGTGETGKIYVALDTNKTYRWSGSAYIYITSGAVDTVNGYTGVVVLDTSDLASFTTDVDARIVAAGLEDNLGNPVVDGYVLSSTIAGVRTWVLNPAGLTGITQSGSPFLTQLGEVGPASLTGLNSTIVGYNAGNNVITGNQLVIIGANAGLNAPGARNICIGYNAGQFSVTAEANLGGNDNVAIGRNTLSAADGTHRTIAIGDSAGQSVTAQTDSVFIGDNAGLSVTSGGSNTFIGSNSGIYNTAGEYNIGLGRTALAGDFTLKLTGDHNIGIGYLTGNALTTGGGNTFVGDSAGSGCASGSSNLALGRSALVATGLTGDYNIAIGYASVNVLASGEDNIGIGQWALRYVTSGADNLGIGRDALASETSNRLTGADNIHVGKLGGAIYTTSTNNLWFGAGPVTGAIYSNTLRIAKPNAVADVALIEGDFSANTITINGDLTTTGNLMISSAAPASAGSTGVAGTVTWEDGFVYVCVATDTWQRAAIATWA